MSDRQAFLDAIEANPLDMDLRKVFADWLQDHDEIELSDHHRGMTIEKYQEAKDWMVRFCIECGLMDYYDEEAISDPVTVSEMLEYATDHLDQGERITQTGSQSAQDALWENERQFWGSFQTLTGWLVPEEKKDAHFIGCSC